MDDVLDLNEPDLRAGLLRLDADRRERRLTKLQCVRKAYDLVARKRVSQGIRLTDQELLRTIPGTVLEAAVKYSWTTDPGYRRQRCTRGRFAAFEGRETVANSSPFVRIPDAELTEWLGMFRVTPDYLTWWLALLGGRIRAWEANSLDLTGLLESPLAVSGLRQDGGGNEQPQLSSVEPKDAASHPAENTPQTQNTHGPLTHGTQPEVGTKRTSRKSAQAVRAARRAILKKYNVKNGLTTINDLARHLGVSRTALYGMTAGDTKRYSDDKLDLVLNKIGCSRTEWNSEPKRSTSSYISTNFSTFLDILDISVVLSKRSQ